MNKTLPALLCLTLLSGSAFGLDQQFLEPIVPISPAIKGQGGVSVSSAEGWDALFSNPAAFATDKTSLTILSLGTTGFVSLAGLNQILANRNTLMNFNLNDPKNPNTTMLNSMLTTTGVGAETTIGSGWVGNGIGGGLLIEDKTFGRGQTLLGSVFTTQQSIVGVIGYARPFDVGMGTLKVGGDLRPEQVSLMTPTVSDLLSNLGNTSAYTMASGFGLGLDLGARWEYGEFKTGLTIRDLGSTVINFNNYSLSTWTQSAGFPLGGNTTSSTIYRIPTIIGLGGSWSPDMGPLAPVMKTTLSTDLQIPIKDKYSQPSFWTWTHLGAEVEFLDFLSLRTGLNQGYFTFGMGAKASVIVFNMAISTDELGRYAGMAPRPALSMELAARL